MKRYLFGYLLLFLMSNCIGYAMEEPTKEVVVTGYAYGDKPIEKLREEALLDAFKRAARQVVGTFVSSYTQVKMFKLVDQSVSTRTEAYIEKYVILEENKEADQYVVKARVSVNTARLYDDLDLKAILRRLERLERKIEITPYAGALLGDNVGNESIWGIPFEFGATDNSTSFGVRLAYNITSSLGIEGTIGYVPGTDFDTKITPRESPQQNLTSSWDQLHFHGNAVYNINIIGGECVPYLTAGLGCVYKTSGSTLEVRASPSGATVKWDKTDLACNFGGGGRWFLNETMAIRVDVRDIVTALGGSKAMHMIETTGGLSFIF